MKPRKDEDVYLAVAACLRDGARRLEELRESPESDVVEFTRVLLRLGALCVSKMADSETRRRLTGVCRSVGLTGRSRRPPGEARILADAGCSTVCRRPLAAIAHLFPSLGIFFRPFATLLK